MSFVFNVGARLSLPSTNIICMVAMVRRRVRPANAVHHRVGYHDKEVKTFKYQHF